MPAAKQTAIPLFLYLGLAVLFAISLTYRVRDTIDRTDELLRGHEIARIPFDIDLPDLAITGVEQPEARAAGLTLQDKIAGINGRPVRSATDLFAPFRNTPAGQPVSLEVQSSAPDVPTRRIVTITLEPMRERMTASAADWASYAIVNIALPYLCLALGFWVVAVRIRDRLAWLLLLLLLSLAEFGAGPWRTLWGRVDWFQPLSVIYQPLFAISWPMSMMLFGIYFPQRLPLDRRFPWVKWIVLTPILLEVGAAVTAVPWLVWNMPALIPFDAAFGILERVTGVLHFAAITIFFAALGSKAFREQHPDARRRLRLLYTGAFIAITPLCVVLILLITGVVVFQPWFLPPLLATLFVFPLTMAYVIVVDQAMDVRVVVRQGVQYLLARGSVRVLQITASIAIFYVAMTRGPAGAVDSSQTTQIAMVLVGASGIFLIGRFADRLRRWVDLRFFREAYDTEQILTELATHVRTIVETRPLLETVAHRISATLHVPRVAILLNGSGMLEPAYAVGYSHLPSMPDPGRHAWEDVEEEIRRTLDAELLLPLSSNRSLLGVMGLGPKQSEEPFTSADIRLLGAVAAQTGLALENTKLTAEIAAEIANREKAKRELEIAREVQERLFPQDYPPIRGIEYEGACRPALGVGGDYYDFITMTDTELGVAIGDVSGKGIPAALLMATLRAYLRGQTIGGESDLATMMANLNQLVYESSAANRYATFFYGHYNASRRIMRYVNAGHNPPMVFRQSGDIVRLDVGGPVIGLIVGCTYEEGEVQLQSGDVLVAFTDGISEAMNSAYEEWGEERLAATVQRDLSAACRPLIERIMCAADGFVAGAPQHDDMTLVVLRQL